MVIRPLLDLVTRKLATDVAEGETWPLLVLAAFSGSQALDAALTEGTAASVEALRTSAATPRAFLSAITVEGFRGIGPARTLNIRPGPGITLVVGRNGSGKSSFAEGLELLLTGSNWRWAERSKVWRDGWRNLHHNTTQILATFAVDGARGELTLGRRWLSGAVLEDAEEWAQQAGLPKGSIESTGWLAASEAYRPLLSYNELGSMFDEGPTVLHDRLARILGLGEIDNALRVLRDVRLASQRFAQEQTSRADALTVRLRQVNDPRAADAVRALSMRTWGLDALERLIADRPSDQQGDLGTLRQLSNLDAPDPKDGRLLGESDTALSARHSALSSSSAGQAERLAQLLGLGLEHYEQHGPGSCPLCGNDAGLNDTWASEVRSRLAEATAAADAMSEIREQQTTLLNEVRVLVGRPPQVLERAEGMGIADGSTRQLWERLMKMPEQAGHLAAHLDPLAELHSAIQKIRVAALAELERREDAWRPVAYEIAGWLSDARTVRKQEGQVRDLLEGERWLKAVSNDLRRERFAPIADRAMQLWELLRQQSSVELKQVMLEGAGTMRRVSLDVTVDGLDGAALGVMSQGELHAIALSLFLPRATLDESPFRFVVIDDPVQSMDPARVDGLARVLEEIATTHQVVVFTHDDRLPESVRRLGIDAVVVQVLRHTNSVVEVRPVLDPVRRNLSDARAIALSDDMPLEVAQQVVPGLCRLAIEAACVEVLRGRRIGRGETHADVEDLIAANPKTAQRMSLVLFDDANRGSDVSERVHSWERASIDAWYGSTKGAHKGYRGPLADLVRDTESLCAHIASLK